MKNILITGGAGYVGSHSILPLQNDGYNVIVYDNLSEGHKDAVKSCELIVGDLADERKLDKLFKEYHIDAVMHFAGSCYVGESTADPQKYFLNNLSNTINLLKVMLNNSVNVFIFSSSCTVYGEPVSLPIKENHPKAPINPYGLSKRFIEQIICEYAKRYDFNYAILRYFNAAGASAEENIGEDHSPETHLIPIVLNAALKGGEKVKVFGGDYNTYDGTCIRDYVHIEDIISAHILTLKAIFENKRLYTFNIGCGMGYSVKEVIKTASEITGREIEYEITEKRDGDVAVLVASSEKINKELGWEPKYKSLADIIATALKWHKNNPYGYNDRGRVSEV